MSQPPTDEQLHAAFQDLKRPRCATGSRLRCNTSKGSRATRVVARSAASRRSGAGSHRRRGRGGLGALHECTARVGPHVPDSSSDATHRGSRAARLLDGKTRTRRFD